MATAEIVVLDTNLGVHCRDMNPSDFDRWARAHHGLITYSESALTNDSWHRAIRSGSLIPMHRHVARLPGTSTTTTQRIAAAVLAAGNGAMASHLSAAHLWDVAAADTAPVDIIISDHRRNPRLDNVAVHHPTDRRRLRPLRRHGIACTNILRTLCDLGAVAPSLVEAAVGSALTQGLVDMNALNTAVVEHGKRGRPGIPALRRALDRWAIDGRPADSVLELAFSDLVSRYRLPRTQFQRRIAGWEVDFWFLDSAVIVECDGWSTHGLDHDQFERDRRKDNDLISAGWQVLRFSYRSIINEPADTAARIRRALERWAHLDVPLAA